MEGGAPVGCRDQHDPDPDRGNQGDPDGGEARRGGHQAAAAPRRGARPQRRTDRHYDNGENHPARGRSDQSLDQVVDLGLVGHARIDAHRPVGAAQDDHQDASEQKEPAEGHHERRDPQSRRQRALDRPDDPAACERHQDRRPPGPAGAGALDQLEGDDPAQERHRTDRQVDLAEEQDRDLRHGQDHVDRAQPEDVDEVAGPQERMLRGDDLEDHGHDGHRQDHGEDPAVAATNPPPPALEVLP